MGKRGGNMSRYNKENGGCSLPVMYIQIFFNAIEYGGVGGVHSTH